MKFELRETEVKIADLHYGDVLQADSGNIYMIVDGSRYLIEDKNYPVLVVNLENGVLDKFKSGATVRPIKLIAREE